MARDWESTFSSWIGRASDSEQTRYESTRDAIRKALAASDRLTSYSFDVYAKGSYPNFTNVVRDSDVDIAAELTELFKNRFIHSAEELTLSDVNVTPYTGSYDLPAFKDDVEEALRDRFGSAVERGRKAIHIRAKGSSGLDADVVPCVTQRTWTSRTTYHDGIRLRNDSSPNELIVNYPKQHLERGTQKNDRTQRRYKRVVRILKRLENEMVERGVIDVVPSFLIESAIWNVPDDRFSPSTWTGRARNTLAYIFNETRSDDCVQSDDWLEANALKYLFFSGQNWTYSQLHKFADRAWDYIGFD